jgi:CO dehydrogenase maturation factor
VNGKGGTGKTTISALLAGHISAKKKGSLLVVDADPNSVLPGLLGIRPESSIVGIVEEISKKMDKIPAGMTKERYIEMRVQEAVSEEEAFDFLVMGRPEGPGCYCYVNNLLRDMMSRLTGGYDFVVMDNAAGMEHISRRTMRSIDRLVLVSDCSAVGVRSAKRIYELAEELLIKMKGAYLVMNRATGPLGTLQGEIDDTGLKLIGVIPYSEEIDALSVADKPILGLKDKVVRSKVEEIFANLMKG